MSHSIFASLLSLTKAVLRVVRRLIAAMLVVILLAAITIVGSYLYFARDLPDIKTLDDWHPPVISEAFSDDGTKIGEFWTECRIFTPYDKIPPLVIQAFVDSEDARFFEHKGVDMRSIVRALIANLRAGTIIQGASTITQQITRSLLLTRERTLHRKIREAILALRLERHLSKEQILTLYLNQIYLGNRAYGVAAAARNYFRKPLDGLTLGQIALIAGLPSAPTSSSPVNNPRNARSRQLHVLRRMVEEGHITIDDARRAKEESFTVYEAGVDKSFNNQDAAYFVEHVRRLVKEHYGDEVLYHKGLKIYTTVNLSMQRIATAVVRGAIESLDRRHGWRGPTDRVPAKRIAKRAKLIEQEILKEQSGHIIPWPPDRKTKATITFTPGQLYQAIVTDFRKTDVFIQIGNISGVIKHDNYKWAKSYSTGWIGEEGRSYVSNPKSILKVGDVVLVRRLKDGTFALAQEPQVQSALLAIEPHSGFIKAMVGGYDFEKSEFNRATQARRQPGSSFKPFVYAAALDKGYTYETAIMDEPIVYQVGRYKFWSPKNYGGEYKGITPFRNALVFSRNVPTVKIAFDIGTHYIAAYARKMGITSPIGKYLSLALGSNAVYLQEMVQAYAVFPNHGRFVPAVAITKIEDREGKVIENIHGEGGALTGALAQPPAKESVSLDRDMLVETGHEIEADELNTALFQKGMEDVAKDNMILTDLEIKTLYSTAIPPDHVITPQTAYLMIDLLKGVVQMGTGTVVSALGKPVAGKTGTTNDETDVWFIGFVPDLVAGVWIGFDELRRLGRRLTGGNTAAPVFLKFMKEATKGWVAKKFSRPEDFPQGSLATMSGGSALFGIRPGQDLPGELGGADRAGKFFEEDLEFKEEVPEEGEIFEDSPHSPPITPLSVE